MAEVKWLFPTPIGIYDLSDFTTEEVNSALQQIGYTTNGLVEGIRGTRDPSKLPVLRPLYDKFQECINHFSNEIGIETSYIYESWMNILSLNGSVGVHRHYDSVISGAYYPYTDEDSVPITFVSSIEGYRMLDVQRAKENGNGMYASNVESVEAKTGRLVLFPGWVQHYVGTNKTNIRITLSFNTKYTT